MRRRRRVGRRNGQKWTRITGSSNSFMNSLRKKKILKKTYRKKNEFVFTIIYYMRVIPEEETFKKRLRSIKGRLEYIFFLRISPGPGAVRLCVVCSSHRTP